MSSMGWCNQAFNSYKKWHVGNDIRTMLLADTGISAQVNEHIYPCIAPEKTEGDFIIYMRRDYKKDLAKAGVYQDKCEMAVIAISEDYDNSTALAEAIDNCLTGIHTLDNGVRLEIELSSSSEAFDDNKYIQTLLFEIK